MPIVNFSDVRAFRLPYLIAFDRPTFLSRPIIVVFCAAFAPRLVVNIFERIRPLRYYFRIDLVVMLRITKNEHFVVL